MQLECYLLNSYSTLQKVLHRISLAPRFSRQLSFDLEKQFFLKSTADPSSSPTFVTGLARSGTTILLRAIFESNEFASLTYEDMPFILAPNLWGLLNKPQQGSALAERAHGDGILVNTESPEAFEEVFWLTHDADEAESEFKNYIQLILHKHQRSRYLSKNNQNVKRIAVLLRLFPDANFLVPFREPLQHAQSLLSQHVRFCEAQTEDAFVKHYMDWIGHSEFGLGYSPIVDEALTHNDPTQLNHWLEQWLLLYGMLNKDFKDTSNVQFVCYENLCADKAVWNNILKTLSLKQDQAFDFRESRKPIAHTYDEALYADATELYLQLRTTP